MHGVVCYPDLRPAAGLVDAPRFVRAVVRRYRLRRADERANADAIVRAAVRWLEDRVRSVLLRAASVDEVVRQLRHCVDPLNPPAEVLSVAMDPQMQPSTRRYIGRTTVRCCHRVAHFVVDRIARTTLRELPYWGCSRVRRAQRIFDGAYDPLRPSPRAPPRVNFREDRVNPEVSPPSAAEGP